MTDTLSISALCFRC